MVPPKQVGCRETHQALRLPRCGKACWAPVVLEILRWSLANRLEIPQRYLKDTSKFQDFQWILYILMLIKKVGLQFWSRNLLDSACSILFDDGLLRWNWNFPGSDSFRFPLECQSVFTWTTGVITWGQKGRARHTICKNNESSWNISICCFIPSQ